MQRNFVQCVAIFLLTISESNGQTARSPHSQPTAETPQVDTSAERLDTKWEAQCDVAGQEIAAAKATDTSQCAEQCRANPSCKAAVFISGWGRCLLKSELKRRVKLIMTSGTPTNPPEADRDSRGKDMRQVAGIKDPISCQAACAAEPACKSFTYISGYSMCWLKSSAPGLIAKVFHCFEK